MENKCPNCGTYEECYNNKCFCPCHRKHKIPENICTCGHEKIKHGWDNGEDNTGSCKVHWYEGTIKPRKICYCPCKKFQKKQEEIRE